MSAAGLLQAVLLAAMLMVSVVIVVGRRRDRPPGVLWPVALLLVTAVAAAATWAASTSRRIESHAELLRSVPKQGLHAEGFVSSDTCQACHPDQYHAWHRSYHRTMTQPATGASVLGDFDDVSLSSRGRSYTLRRAGGEFWVDMVDPDWERDLYDRGVNPDTAARPPRTAKRVVMTTGSHHMQTYWVASERDGRLFNFSWVWLNDDRRWVPRADVFMRPQHWPRMMGTWHDNCIECHSVAGEQNFDAERGTWSPEVAQLGIACEACHGPGREHVRANRDPKRRYRLRLNDEPDPTIVNPSRLAARASSQVCGQCHGMNIFKGDALRDGVRYRAGGDLTETRMLLRTRDDRLWPDERDDWPRLQRHIERELRRSDAYLESRLWPDGMVRVSGREHNAMVESACFMGGELSCLSCHSMHRSDPDDMLAAGREGDGACLECHAGVAGDVTRHTHHGPGSPGSSCLNCHMPHTTYGLLKAIRSHGIDSPTVASTLETGRPNACNLCHLDRSLRWTADHLRRWYDQPEVALEPDQERVAAAAHWALSGDAHQRALVAWHMGWAPAWAASGRDWIVPYLGHLMNDPYAVNRYIAHRSLRRFDGFESFPYDYVAPAAQLADAPGRVVRRWLQVRGPRLDRTGSEVLVTARGELDVETISRLAARRDDRVLDLRE